MIYMRGQARDYDQWAELTGDDSWRWDNALPYFRRHEDHWRLDQPSGVNENFKRLHGNKSHRQHGRMARGKAAPALGCAGRLCPGRAAGRHSATDDFNGGSNEGVGYFEVNQKNGWRWNTAKAFLRPTCYGRPNFEMWTAPRPPSSHRDAARRQPRCTGVQVWDGHEMVTARATREVLLSAGAVNSPQLLQLSGIGPAALLRQHGIDVVHDLPGVGANLQDHLQIRSVYKVQGVPTLNTMANSLVGKAKIGLEYASSAAAP
jgi:choline dehydrogenase